MYNKKNKIKIEIPKNIKILKKDNTLIFLGPLGLNKLKLDRLELDNKKIKSSIFFSKKINCLLILCKHKKNAWTYLSIIKNKFYGITRGFLVYLKIIGIGYRASLEKPNNSFIDLNSDKETKNLGLRLKVGFSHDWILFTQNSVRLFLIDPTIICIYGVDKNQITQIAVKIRKIRPPSIYKGKGIKFLNENLSLKKGKSK